LRRNFTIRATIISRLTGLRYQDRIGITRRDRKGTRRAKSLNHKRHGRKFQNSRTEDLPGTMTNGPHEITTEDLRETMTEVRLPSTVTKAIDMRQIGRRTETGTIEGDKTVTQGREIAALIVRNQALSP
jgi:hypothetical protein